MILSFYVKDIFLSLFQHLFYSYCLNLIVLIFMMLKKMLYTWYVNQSKTAAQQVLPLLLSVDMSIMQYMYFMCLFVFTFASYHQYFEYFKRSNIICCFIMNKIIVSQCYFKRKHVFIREKIAR